MLTEAEIREGLRDAWGWDAEVCKRCLRANPIGFQLADAMWAEITQHRWNVLCLLCVNELAAPLGIDWTKDIQGELYLVSAAMCAPDPEDRRADG